MAVESLEEVGLLGSDVVATLHLLPFVGDCGGTVICHDDCKGNSGVRFGCLQKVTCNCHGKVLVLIGSCNDLLLSC